jgi:hypothetical protein
VTWKYRYRRDYFPDAELVEDCNALGEEGWSIVGPPRWVPPEVSRSSAPGSVGVWACFFKRTVSAREQLAEVFRLSPAEAER